MVEGLPREFLIYKSIILNRLRLLDRKSALQYSSNGTNQENFEQRRWPQERSTYSFVNAKVQMLDPQDTTVSKSLPRSIRTADLGWRGWRLLLTPSSLALNVFVIFVLFRQKKRAESEETPRTYFFIYIREHSTHCRYPW